MKDEYYNNKKEESLQGLQSLDEVLKNYRKYLEVKKKLEKMSDDADRCIKETDIVTKICQVYDEREGKSDLYTVLESSSYIMHKYEDLLFDFNCKGLNMLAYKIACALKEKGKSIEHLEIKIKSRKLIYRYGGIEKGYTLKYCKFQIAFRDKEKLRYKMPSIPAVPNYNFKFILDNAHPKAIAKKLFEEFVKERFPSYIIILGTAFDNPIEINVPIFIFYKLFSDKEVMNEIKSLANEYGENCYKEQVIIMTSVIQENDENYLKMSFKLNETDSYAMLLSD